MTGSLAHAPCEIARQLLVDLSLGTDPGGTWPVFAYNEPDKPDDLITIFSAGIEHQGGHMFDGVVSHLDSVSIRIRAAEDNAGYVKCNAIAQALDTQVDKTSVTIGASVYLIQSAARVNGPLAIGKEPKTGRVVFVLNYSFALKQTT